MFLSLGVAVASSLGSRSLIIPENGYTGINLPLRPNRGGALSTRSTHPETFRRVAEILTALNKPEQFILAVVQIDSVQAVNITYVREPFSREPDFGVTSVNYRLSELLVRGESPR